MTQDSDIASPDPRRWWVVVGVFAVMFGATGALFSFPVFVHALQSAFGSSLSALSWVQSTAICLYFVAGAVGGLLADRWESRGVVLLGTFLMALGLLVAAAAQTYWELYAGFGFGVGIGVGLAFVPAIGVVSRWFQRQGGLATGLAASGGGFGILCVPKGIEWTIESQGWRVAFLVLTALSLIAGSIGWFAIGRSPGGPMSRASIDGWIRAAVLSPPFLLIYAAAFLASPGLHIPFVHLIRLTEEQGMAHSTAVTLFTLVGIGNTCGRFMLGHFGDQFGHQRVLALMFLGVAVTLTWWFAAATAWQIGLFSIVFGSLYGGIVALTPVVIANYFGTSAATGLIGLAYTSVAAGALLGPSLAGHAFEQSGSYAAPILMSAAAAFVSAALIWFAPKPPWIKPSRNV